MRRLIFVLVCLLVLPSPSWAQLSESAPPSSLVNIVYSESLAAPTAATWTLRKYWVSPASAVFSPSSAWASVTTAGSRTLIGTGQSLGTFDTSTNVFTVAGSVASPRHYGRVFACVSTAMSAVANTLSSITYVNDVGSFVTASISPVTSIPASAPTGNCFEILLPVSGVGFEAASRDAGLRSISALVDTAAPTGVLTLFGINSLLDTLGVANALEVTTFDQGVLSSGEAVFIFLQQVATTAQQRNAGVSGSIR